MNPHLKLFIEHCNASSLEKILLDCGAGIPGEKVPPLVYFHQQGFETHGIDISARNIAAAEEQARKLGIDLRISPGDMRKIPFENASMSFVYSYNTIFHMSKADMAAAMGEIKRVLKPGGLCFVNFFSVEHSSFGKGEEIGDREFLYDEDGEPMSHSFLEDHEADALFEGMEVVYREKRRDLGTVKRTFLDYIAKKTG